MKRLKADLSLIRLWEQNPRIEETSSQTEALKAIYESGSGEQSEANSRRQLLNLAESISEKGFQTEVDPLIAVEHEGIYIVQDGNRRLSALLLLRDPESYDFLKSHDLKRLKNMRKNSTVQLPSKVEMVVFSPDEDSQMREVISRKHNGQLDGVGVVQWGTKAKQRFTNTQEFSDCLESPFEAQHGETLSSYLGGADAVTTTHRLFGLKVARNYLDIKDGKVTPEVIDRAKQLADVLKSSVSETGTPLSRLNAPDVRRLIENIKQDKSTGSAPNTSPIESTTKSETSSIEIFRKMMATSKKQGPGILGMEFVTGTSFRPEIKEFWLVNRMIYALTTFGQLVGDEEQRKLKMLILCPAIRVFFELSLKGMKDSLPTQLKCLDSLGKNHKRNVQAVAEMLTNDDKFINYLVSAIPYDGYNQAKTVITARKFADSADESNLTSHSADQMLGTHHTESLFNDAVLFASLCQHYVHYVRGNPKTP